MKILRLTSIIILACTVLACEKGEDFESNEFTGNEESYTLFSGSDWGFYGEVTFKEKKDGMAQVIVHLENTEGPLEFPVHLHNDSYDIEADLIALLSPLKASNGISISESVIKADETAFTYKELIDFDGHIKIHLDEEANKDVILAYGNIGANQSKPIDQGMAACSSELKN